MVKCSLLNIASLLTITTVVCRRADLGQFILLKSSHLGNDSNWHIAWETRFYNTVSFLCVLLILLPLWNYFCFTVYCISCYIAQPWNENSGIFASMRPFHVSDAFFLSNIALIDMFTWSLSVHANAFAATNPNSFNIAGVISPNLPGKRRVNTKTYTILARTCKCSAVIKSEIRKTHQIKVHQKRKETTNSKNQHCEIPFSSTEQPGKYEVKKKANGWNTWKAWSAFSGDNADG